MFFEKILTMLFQKVGRPKKAKAPLAATLLLSTVSPNLICFLPQNCGAVLFYVIMRVVYSEKYPPGVAALT